MNLDNTKVDIKKAIQDVDPEFVRILEEVEMIDFIVPQKFFIKEFN